MNECVDMIHRESSAVPPSQANSQSPLHVGLARLGVLKPGSPTHAGLARVGVVE
jgi:hypothetical protein